MRHHKEGGRFKALDEQAALIIERWIGRPANGLHALCMQPVFGGIEQSLGCIGVVFALKKTKKASLFVVSLDMACVHDRRDAANIPVATGGQKRLAA